MKPCEMYAGNCGVCMIAAPYPYCCRKECGEHEYCTGCAYNDKEDQNGEEIYN